MTQEELSNAYALSARPYLEGQGPIPAFALSIKSWRYLIEVNTACNLRCAMCISGNRDGFEHESGIMPMPMLEKILDKIKSENPNAILCPYGSGEPFLHPNFDKVVKAVTSRGLHCEVATNLHFTKGIEGVLEAKPDIIIISTSGFTQEVYERAHKGGDIEQVKDNMKRVAQIRLSMGSTVPIAVSFHRYKYNLHELQAVEEFAKSLGFIFWSSHARVISMENTIQSLRAMDRDSGKSVPIYATMKNGLNLNTSLPQKNEKYISSMEQLLFHPKDARKLYEKYPVAPVCIIADTFTYIRHNGQVQLCAWTDDRRFVLGNYLDMTQEQLSEARRGFPFCSECLRYRMNLYYHCVDFDKV